ncbi:hypothetical protein A2U01_0061643, partial [Trifolium medium]|nr:hypothetical protein [Trifolium medium]
RYGVERGRLREGGSRGSSWWKELVCIQDGGCEVEGGWFWEHISKQVGDRSNTFSGLILGWTGSPCVSGLGDCLT